MRKIVPMLVLLLFFGATVNAQTVAVQGKVTDVSGPVSNATIQEKGTKNIVQASNPYTDAVVATKAHPKPFRKQFLPAIF